MFRVDLFALSTCNNCRLIFHTPMIFRHRREPNINSIQQIKVTHVCTIFYASVKSIGEESCSLASLESVYRSTNEIRKNVVFSCTNDYKKYQSFTTELLHVKDDAHDFRVFASFAAAGGLLALAR